MLSRLAAVFALLALIPGALVRIGADATLLSPQVKGQLAASGVESPVTAVLLNFRSLDTLLEVSVLAAAVIGALALPPPRPPSRDVPPYSLLPTWLIPRMAPVMGMLVIYLWWAGSSQPGGAFQAGAAFTGLLLLLYFIERPGHALVRRSTGLRLALLGPAVFLAVGALPLLGGAVFLHYPEGLSKAAILTIEAGLTASIGGALALLATGSGERH